MPATYHLPHLRTLEAEAIQVMREVAAEFERPVLLFSGGKDSIVLLRLAEKAFRPAPFPFPLMHVDTGHNFPEAIEFRDRRVAELGERLIVAHVQDSIDSGRAVEETGPRASRNKLLEVPSIYFAHEREVFERDGMLYAVSPFVELMAGEEPFSARVRYRTVGDMSCTGAVESDAETLAQVVAEIAATRITERGETRADDRVTEAAMEDRKREGYF